jgi:hypothetical protein
MPVLFPVSRRLLPRGCLLKTKAALNLLIVNWPAKVLSLLGALLLFQFHRANTLDTRTLSVPLRIENAGDMIPVNNYQKMVRVTFRGDRRQMDPITENDVDAFLDLLYCSTPGTYTLPVGLLKKGNALNIDTLEIITDPLDVRLELDHIGSKNIPVKPDILGALPEQYELVSTSIHPAVVVVSGPQSLLKKMSFLSTEAVNLEGKTESFTATLRIVNNEPLLDLPGNKTAEFSAFIRGVIPGRRFDVISARPVNVAGALQAQIVPAGVSVYVQSENDAALQALDESSLLVTVDCAGIEENGSYTLPVQVTVLAPGGWGDVDDGGGAQDAGGQRFSVVKVLPEYVEVTISGAQ